MQKLTIAEVKKSKPSDEQKSYLMEVGFIYSSNPMARVIGVRTIGTLVLEKRSLWAVAVTGPARPSRL